MGVFYSWNINKMKCSAEDAGKVFRELSESPQGLRDKTLLEASRPINAPLHNDFEWDDSIAGEKYRLYQAKNMICNLKVTISSDEEHSNSGGCVRAFVITNEDKNGSRYEPIEVAVKDDNKRKVVMDRALKELNAFSSKYRGFKELFDVVNDVELIIEKYSA